MKRLWRNILRMIGYPLRMRYEMANGNIDNLGVVMNSAIQLSRIDQLSRMCRSLANLAEEERAVKVYGHISNDRLNYELIEAINRGEVRYGLRGYFSVAGNGDGLQIAILMPGGGKVEFIFAEDK